ncbi:transmembrane protein 17-like [Hemitrygon akajei]|uniref:transmembrane protein 17-like n=1 Tax=Hemitrygon akajei TaxID=2704970 RepID=UPI003BFA0955
MSLHSSLPHNIRQNLTNLTGTLFVSNRTRDCGDALNNIPVNETVSSLPLQMALYFNVIFFPFWWVSEVFMIHLKYNMLPGYYQWLLLAAIIIITVIESIRLCLGYMGNLEEKLPELAGFWLLSFVIQLPIILFLLTDESIIIVPLERGMNIIYSIFLVFELVLGFRALREMTNHLTKGFYLQQFQEPEYPQRHKRSQETGIPFGSGSIFLV